MKSFKVFENKELTYVFVGDLMQHPQQLEYEKSKNFSYTGVFDEIQPILDQGDFVIGNLETLLTNNFVMPEYRSSIFNAPKRFGETLKRVGFTHLVCKNNHMYDLGKEGYRESVDLIKKCGIVPIDNRTSVGVMDIINFTTHFNDLGSDRWGFTEIAQEIDRLTESSERMQACFVHWGDQYNPVANTEQLETKLQLEDAGYTLIVGSGPHSVNQTTMDDGVLTAYSLGDFLSAHQKPGTTDVGKILVVTVRDNKVTNYMEYDTETIDTNGRSRIVLR